jgi:hypothetical protein
MAHELMKSFKNPPADCSQIPFWFLNGKVDGDEYCQQIDEMAKNGIMQAMPHPRFGMDRRDYLAPAYWNAMSQLLKHASQNDFLIHLYDEFNWSSGPAGGKLTEKRENCALGITMRSIHATGPAKVTLKNLDDGFCGWGKPEKILISGIFRNSPEKITFLEDSKFNAAKNEITLKIPSGNWTAFTIYTLRTIHPSPLVMGNGGIIDYLSRKTTAEFIRATHEQYYKHLGSYFGNTIPSIFYDESAPYASGMFTWTDNFLSEFRKIKGYDLKPLLPALFFENKTCGIKSRVDYWDVLTGLFTENHIGQMADWCEKHKIALTGHTYEETDRWMLTGDLFSILRRQHWPGLDSLGGYKPYHLHKPAAGAKEVSGKSVLLCESLGLLGNGDEWKASPRLIREVYNQLAVVGVTHVVPHAFFQTLDNPKVECPPDFFKSNFYWRYYDTINKMTACQCHINRISAHVAEIAILYPVVSWFADSVGGRGGAFPWQVSPDAKDKSASDRISFENTVNLLMSNQLDHTVIDSKALIEAEIESSSLKISSNRYKIIIVPPMNVARFADIEKIADFADAGGLVIFSGKFPQYSAGNESAGMFKALITRLKKLAKLAESAKDIPGIISKIHEPDIKVLSGDKVSLECAHRKSGTSDIYVLSNHSEKANNFKLRFRCLGKTSLLDPETGNAYNLHSEEKGIFSEVKIKLAPHTAPYLIFEKERTAENLPELPVHMRSNPGKIIPVTGTWEFLPLSADTDFSFMRPGNYSEIEIPVFMTRTLSIQSTEKEIYSLWDKWFIPDFDDSKWETVHCRNKSLLYSDSDSRLFRAELPPGTDAIKLPLPIKKEFALYIHGKLVKIVKNHPAEENGWLEFKPSDKVSVLAIESASMAPDFGIKSPLVIRCRPAKINLCSWTNLGLGWFSGFCEFRKNIHLNIRTDSKYCIDLGEVRECAEIFVNGKAVSVRIWPPYSADITQFLKTGNNDIRIVVSNLLANRFSWDILGTRGNGSIPDSGLLGTVKILEMK